MRLGVTFPQLEIGSDPAVIRDYAQTAEGVGYDHLLAYDHVLGANPNREGGWSGPYSSESLFHEPFVLYGYLAGLTQRLELVTGVLIGPQRQTALIAKQAAEVDVLSQGRLRLGIGTGWNALEYEGLNENFHNRGRREEEQIEVLRALWTQPVVTFNGRWHTIPNAGINPLPVQRPIPIWLGGTDDRVLRRVARIADGWFPLLRVLGAGPEEQVERLRGYIREAGRKPEDVGIEGRVNAADTTPKDWVEKIKQFQTLGMSHASYNTMGAGFASPRAHIDAIQRFKEVVSEVMA